MLTSTFIIPDFRSSCAIYKQAKRHSTIANNDEDNGRKRATEGLLNFYSPNGVIKKKKMK